MRRISLGIGVVFALWSSASLAQSGPACWNRDVERLDYYENPPEGGDNNFFTSVSNQDQNTNVVLLYSATSTMKAFTQKLYRIRVDLGGATPTGCGNQYLNKMTYFMPTDVSAPAGTPALQGTYSPTKTYPDPGPMYSGGSGQSDGLSNSSYYRYGNWGMNGSGIVAESAATACTNAGGLAQLVACQMCVTTNGYWLNPLALDNDTSPAAGVFSGNWMRFHPSKWAMMSLAYKRLVNGPLLSVLREGVEAQNGKVGGQIVQKMLPQSCSGAGRPINQKLGAIDSLSYTSGANPLAEMLFNAGWYMAGQPSIGSWPFTNSATVPGAAMATGKSGPCNTCSGDFVVVFSDGRGDTANSACTPVAGVTPPACSAAAQCSTVGMGAEDDGNDFLDPSLAGGASALISGSTVRQTPAGTCDMDFADDVARWMSGGTSYKGIGGENVRTFVVAIGDPDNTYNEMSTLQQVASAGNGQFAAADNFRDLENAINTVLTTIINRATSFSAAAVTTVQSTGYTSALIPRFRPNGGVQWGGSLMRFQLFNEFASGCTNLDFGTRNTRNPNGNGSCNDVYLADVNNNFIGEDSNGNFVQLDTSGTWDAGWPILGNADAGTEIPAIPAWEAATALNARENAVIAGSTSQARQIYTVASDSSGSYNPTLIPFNVANVSSITPLLQLGLPTDDYCTTLSHLTRHSYATADACATDVINFVQGVDVLMQNPYNRTIPAPTVPQARPNVLGDIFHSNPVLVAPPVQTYLCDLGIAPQCVASLYSPVLTPGGWTAYQTYATTNQYRTEFVVVGSNDGMIHAFNAGNDTVVGGVHSYDLGSGQELWAFIPPDVLPKLIRYVIGERHELMVDGSPMVRDVWADGSGSSPGVDHQKQADEYHTVAVVGEREGGRHFVGLDVSNPSAPSFLWVWPPPGTADDLNAGETWNDIGPGAAPVGPIAEADGSGAFKIHNVTVKERYVIALGGGYDPAFLRGRSVNFLDVWTGAPVYRFSAADASSSTDPRSKLFSVAAPISMLDTDNDGIFDTSVAADIGGQVWTVSMFNPGQPTGSNSLYNNWFGGRSFIEFKTSAFWNRSPFFQRSVAASLPTGEIRILLGSGDRDQIKDPNPGGTCGLANLSACLRKNCSVSAQAQTYQVGSGGHYALGTYTFSAGSTAPTQTLSVDANSPGNDCSQPLNADLEFTVTCSGSANASWSSLASCDWGNPECPTDTGRPMGTQIAFTPSFTMQSSRFYNIKLFDGASRMPFTTSAGAAAYDAAALTDTDLVDASVTVATASGNGYYLAQNHSSDEKTSSSALLLGGCAIWNTLQPTTAAVTTCGGLNSVPLDTAYTYQADVTTGAISCGQVGSSTYNSTVRSVARSTYVAPQQPAMVISVNKLGQVAYGGISLEPGAAPLSSTTGTGNVNGGTVQWLEVPRKVHDCRHGGVNCK